jgi:hypothetical protein
MASFAGDRTAADAGLTTQQKVIQEMYLNILGRAGSAAELNMWLNTMNGAGGQAAMVQGIENSPEARDNLVKGWYQVYLGRAANGTEEQNFVQALLTGVSEEQVLSRILGSQEFFDRAQTLVSSGSPNERFVQALYQLLLQRTASAGEVSGQVAALSGGQSRFQVALGFMQSQEFRAELVALYYSTVLHRSATPAEIATWAASGLTSNAMRMDFETSAEFAANG